MLKSIIVEVIENCMPTRGLDEQKQMLLKKLIESDMVRRIHTILPPENYHVKGHTKMGRLADVPWVGIHDTSINSRPQSGVYLAILFNIDGSGFAISIQHGTDNLNKNEILAAVNHLSSEFMMPASDFKKTPLTIRPPVARTTTQPSYNRAKNYEIANLLGKEYSAQNIPESIESDLLQLLTAYKSWVALKKLNDDEATYQLPPEENIFADISLPSTPQPRNNVMNHVSNFKPPRNRAHGEKALLEADYRCESNPLHQSFQSYQGKPYMEKHHLIPMEQYRVFELSIDHYSNIYSLCPICHRMIHYGRDADKRDLIRKLFDLRKAQYQHNYQMMLDDLLKCYDLVP